MTEGGDIDKLGRGTVWRSQITDCLHQNHVFAVRVNERTTLPEWISLHTESTHGRTYFRVAAKRTSNLASVNKTQVSAFPIGLVSYHEQTRIVRAIGRFDSVIESIGLEIASLCAVRSALYVLIFGGGA